MTGSIFGEGSRAQRVSMCVARAATVFGIAAAALASCQTYEAEADDLRLTPARELNEWALCENEGGRWMPQAKACAEGAPLVDEGAP